MPQKVSQLTNHAHLKLLLSLEKIMSLGIQSCSKYDFVNINLSNELLITLTPDE
jgi:hypothetical protein